MDKYVYTSKEFGGYIPIYKGGIYMPTLQIVNSGTPNPWGPWGVGGFPAFPLVDDGIFTHLVNKWTDYDLVDIGAQYGVFTTIPFFVFPTTSGNNALVISIYLGNNNLLSLNYTYIDKNGNTLKEHSSSIYQFAGGVERNYYMFLGVDSSGVTIPCFGGNSRNLGEGYDVIVPFVPGGTVSDVLPYSEENFESYAAGSDEYGDYSSESDYGGTFDFHSTGIGIPTAPAIGVSNLGMINVYKPAINSLVGFGEALFPKSTAVEYVPGGADLETILDNLSKSIANAWNNGVSQTGFNNLVDYIIDCHIIPVSPAIGAAENIKVGNTIISGITANKVTQDYVDFDCGTIKIDEPYGNYIDYAPYTKIKIYLPFIGFQQLKPEHVYGCNLTVKYRFNVIDGSCMAWILSDLKKNKQSDGQTIIGQFSGSSAIHIPITGANYASMMSGIVSGIAQTATAGAMANPVGMLQGAVNTMSAKPEFTQSNSYNSSTSFLGVRKVFLTFEWPKSNFSQNYPKEKGLPSNLTVKLSSCHGFTIAKDLHLDAIVCTEEEKNEIAGLLSNGVIL